MSTLVVSIQVAAPSEDVFAVYTDLEKAAERIPSITALEVLTDGPFGEGTRWRETRLMMKKEATEEMWVTGFAPPDRYDVEAESNGMRYRTVFRFEPDDGGTRVTWEFESTPQTFGAKVLGPVFSLLFGGMMKRFMLEDLEALRGVCEAQAASTA